MSPEGDHHLREILHTLYGLRDILKDLLRDDSLEMRIVRIEEQIRAHGKLMGAVGATLAVIASALIMLAS